MLLVVEDSRPLLGEAAVNSDKSISHRLVLLASQGSGTSTIDNILLASDIKATIDALKKLGVDISLDGKRCRIKGIGVGKLLPTEEAIDMGNSGTGARLL